MTISRRNIVRIITFTVSIAAVLLVRNIQLMRRADSNGRALEYSYMRAVEELSTAVDNVNTSLEKQLYAGTPKLQLQLAEKLWRDASTAKAALDQLPIEELQLENTYKFLSQVGNYAMALSQKAADGQEITKQEYENLENLLDFSEDLCENMWELENSINSGEISLTKVATAMRNSDDSTATIDGSFEEFENGFDKYPTLIYDGPFSDNILTKQPRMTTGAAEVTQKEALQKASMSTGINSTDLSQVTEESSTMPSWVFSDANNTISCAVTKNGGYLSYFLKSRMVENETLTMEEGLSKAEQFLSDLGVNSMKTTYYENYNGILTVNFAYNDNDICVYTDLIKVSVALDNGEILGYDARGFLVNHEKRTYSTDRISPLDAQDKLSPMLSVKSKQLALIPSDGDQELLCYEFKCTNQEGRNVLVYVNAVTGNEEQILILYESESGTLTM